MDQGFGKYQIDISSCGNYNIADFRFISVLLFAKFLWRRSFKNPHDELYEGHVCGLCCFVWAERGPVPSWLPTHPLPFSTCTECQTHNQQSGLSQWLWWAPAPLAPNTGSHSLFRLVRPNSDEKSDRQKQAAPTVGQSWHFGPQQ